MSSPLEQRAAVPANHMPGSLVAAARMHAEAAPAMDIFTFLNYTTETPVEERLDYQTLDRRARQIGARLRTRAQPGARVLLLYPAGIEYVCAFFGCLYAGMVAVPVYPPLNPRLKARLAAVAQDCEAAIALSTRDTLQQLNDAVRADPVLSQLQWMVTDTALDGFEFEWRDPATDAGQVAFLQYTSGSTGTPKGVIVTHGNLLHNLSAITAQMGLGAGDHVFSWLPPYHDMGLVGCLLVPFFSRVPLTFMAPLAFLRRPLRWLREISARGCTVSGAPNFAYKLCLEKVSDADVCSLDLSRWSLAFSGSEPVQWNTIERFAERFAPSGFSRSAFYPCYGMAETTLMVTGKQREHEPGVLTICGDTYAGEGRARVVDAAAQPAAGTRWVVACGVAAPGMQVAIVKPCGTQVLADGQVGEILVEGDSITAGYWRREGQTREAFGVALGGRDGEFFRTGDLGFVLDGQLYVSGRLKDLIILRGVNHYPQDIEATVDQCHGAIRPGNGIAFPVEVEGEERLVFVQEVGRREVERSQEIVHAMRAAIQARHDIQPYEIVLIEGGSIPKTTSGKLSRRPCREDYRNDRLTVLARWVNPVFLADNVIALPEQAPAVTPVRAQGEVSGLAA